MTMLRIGVDMIEVERIRQAMVHALDIDFLDLLQLLLLLVHVQAHAGAEPGTDRGGAEDFIQLAVADEEPQAQVTALLGGDAVVQREPGRVEPAVLTAVEHRDQVAAELVPSSVLVEDPRDPAHLYSLPRRMETIR